MTVLKTSALIAAFVGAVGLGVVARPYVIHEAGPSPSAAVPVKATPQADRPTPASSVAAHPENTGITQALAVRLKPLLKPGASMALAAQGFTRADDFAAVAHASNNLDIPFVLLKHRVVDEHMTLARAIHASRPSVDASVEAARARAEARSDVVATRIGL
ncbi:MAG TPA: hypothetical protein VLT86_16730 [Vicinamibacterales bacterium]|nr:hypothetical protein [Vicinamibacterales bacterium]